MPPSASPGPLPWRRAAVRRQAALLESRLPGHEVVADHGWGLVGTTVLRVRHDGADLIVKAGDDADTHIARELRAHREWLAPLVARGRAPELRHADADAKLLVTRYLPGTLVQDTPAEHEPSTYRGAGELLALLHERPAVVATRGTAPGCATPS
ncbi:hypothetical protein [Pseudonocardia sp. ICBG601]|uniref:hypothetical protein n=1 Tax=Pseudonocardia sp. ICBG601 TaxID=2846759 RepID=UPI001CF6991D|nr:hypothetical protein [Pseudonocardia sp. ICBG601]